MTRLVPLSVGIVCVTALACGGGDPDLRTADWEENFNRVNKATSSGQHDQAIAIAEAFLQKHPDNVDGHLMVGSALMDAGRAASNHTRPARFEQAVTHYKRVLEVTKNPNWRLLATSGLVQLHGVEALNKPDEAIRYQRMLITNNPGSIAPYSGLLYLLKEGKKYDEAVSLLAEAKDKMDPTPDAVATYAGMVHDLVAFSPELPRDTGRTLLTEAVALVDRTLNQHGRTEKLVRSKSALLGWQSQLEPDAARASALDEEALRLLKEANSLAKD